MAAGDVEANVTSMRAFPCAVFDGVDDRITLENSAGEILKHDYSSIGLWVKQNELGSISYAFTHAKTGTPGNRLYINFSTSGNITVNVGAVTNAYDSSAISKNWNRVIVTIDRINLRYNVYFNNVLVISNKAFTFVDDWVDIYLGYEATPQPLSGCMSNICIWNKILSQTEITKDYSGEKITDNLIHQWKLDKDYTDSVGSNDGTNSGSILQIREDQVAAAIAADRTTANDTFLMVGVSKQIVSTVIEEAP